MTTTGTRGSATLELPTCPRAAEIAANVRTGRESAREACAAALARIAETESSVHAWHHLDAAQALERAQAIDDAGPQGALAGVPVAVKDIIDTADQPTENGTPLDAGRRPGADATVVRRLRAAGALILGKTVTTELACGAARATRNPHAFAHTPGGSSSGSAATVAAGGVPLALGTQTAGSVVRPAAFCGVWGMKPSFGTIPRTGVTRLSRTLDHVGVLAGSAQDVALGIDAISGDDGLDQASAGQAPTRLVAALALPLGQPRLAFIRQPAWEEVGADAAAAYEAAAVELGAEPLTLGSPFDRAAAAHLGIMRREVAHAFTPWFARGEADLSDIGAHAHRRRAGDRCRCLSLSARRSGRDAARVRARSEALRCSPDPCRARRSAGRAGLYRQPLPDHALDHARRAGGQCPDPFGGRPAARPPGGGALRCRRDDTACGGLVRRPLAGSAPVSAPLTALSSPPSSAPFNAT